MHAHDNAHAALARQVWTSPSILYAIAGQATLSTLTRISRVNKDGFYAARRYIGRNVLMDASWYRHRAMLQQRLDELKSDLRQGVRTIDLDTSYASADIEDLAVIARSFPMLSRISGDDFCIRLKPARQSDDSFQEICESFTLQTASFTGLQESQALVQLHTFAWLCCCRIGSQIKLIVWKGVNASPSMLVFGGPLRGPQAAYRPSSAGAPVPLGQSCTAPSGG